MGCPISGPICHDCPGSFCNESVGQCNGGPVPPRGPNTDPIPSNVRHEPLLHTTIQHTTTMPMPRKSHRVIYKVPFPTRPIPTPGSETQIPHRQPDPRTGDIHPRKVSHWAVGDCSRRAPEHLLCWDCGVVRGPSVRGGGRGQRNGGLTFHGFLLRVGLRYAGS